MKPEQLIIRETECHLGRVQANAKEKQSCCWAFNLMKGQGDFQLLTVVSVEWRGWRHLANQRMLPQMVH